MGLAGLDSTRAIWQRKLEKLESRIAGNLAISAIRQVAIIQHVGLKSSLFADAPLTTASCMSMPYNNAAVILEGMIGGSCPDNSS